MSPRCKIELADLIDVVKAGVLHGGAGEKDRLEAGHGRQRAALADLPFHVPQNRLHLLGGIFEGDHPARGLAGGAQAIALLERIDLDDHPVGLIGELAADFGELFDRCDDLIDRFAPAEMCSPTGKCHF